MLGPIKNRKEINKSFYNAQENLNTKEKLNKLNKLSEVKKADNKFMHQNLFNSSFLTQQINDKEKNKNVERNNKDKDNKIITFSGLQKKSVLNKKNYLIPINKKSLHKINSTPNLLSNDSNNNNIFSTRQTYKNINFSRNNKLQTLKKSLNDSYNSNNNLNNINTNNISGFNTTKNNNTNYFFSNNNSRFFMSSYDNNFSQIKIPKKRYFSKFFYKSQSKLVTSKRIFRHYIKEEEKDVVKPIKYFLRGGAPKPIKDLRNIYKDNYKFDKRIKEIKCNSTIAFKDDFNILDYQSTLIKLLSNRISEKNLHELQKNFVLFNEKNFGMVGPKGRFTNMAEKIKYNIPLYLYEKIKKLDTDKLISRYNYYKKINQNISKKFKKKCEQKKNKKKKEAADSSKADISQEINNNKKNNYQ